MPDLETFSEGIKKLERWYGKTLSGAQIAIWKEKTDWIPNKPFRDILEHCINKSRSFPLPGVFAEEWRDWQDTHRDQVRNTTEKTICEECNSRGYLEYWKTLDWMAEKYEMALDAGLELKPPPDYLYIAKCAKCNNYAFPKSFPRLTKEDIIGKMWMSKEPEPSVDGPFKYAHGKVTLNDFGNGATKDLDDEIGWVKNSDIPF